MSPLLHFSSYEVSSLVRSNVWSILTVDKTLCKSMDSSFCRSVMCITRKSIHSSRDKAFFAFFHSGSGPVESICLQILAGHSGEWCHGGLGISFCGWEISTHSSYSGSVLLNRRDPCCRAHACNCHHGHLS